MNIYHASAKGKAGMVIAKDAKKMMVTECKTHGKFLEWFVQGVDRQTGDIVKSDSALSFPVAVGGI